MNWYNIKMKVISTVIILSFLYLTPLFIFASNGDGGTGGPDGGTGGRPIKLPNPLRAGTIPELIQEILKFLVAAGAPVATLMIIIGAYQMLFAGGSPEKFETGKKTILYTVIAYVIILLALGLASVIKDILGVSGSS